MTFPVPGPGRRAAELEAERKNVSSHRGKALRRLIARPRERG